MKKILLAPIWIIGLGIMALGTHIVLACEWACEELKGFWT